MKTIALATTCVIAGLLTASGAARSGGEGVSGQSQPLGEQSPPKASVLVTLNPKAAEFPEGIVVPQTGPQKDQIFFSFVFRVQVLRVKGNSYEPWSTIPDPTDRAGLGLACDEDGNMYWAIGAVGPKGTSPPGIYRVPNDAGVATLVTPANFPSALADGIDVVGNQMYWTDAIFGSVNVTDLKTGATRVWSNDPLLAGDTKACGGTPFPAPLGANGISHYRHNIYVTNTNFGRVLRIPIKKDGDAGKVEVIAESCENLHGLDGLATDTNGTLVATRQPNSSLLRINRNRGKVKVLYAGAPLDGPASNFIWNAPDGNKLHLLTNSTLGSPPGGPGPSIAALNFGDSDDEL